MIKPLSITALFVITISMAFAQFPEAGTKNFTFGISSSGIGINTSVGHTGSLLFKYYKSQDLAFRFSCGLNYSTNSNTSATSSGKSNTKTIYSAGFSPGFGFQKDIFKADKFEIFWGSDFILGYSYSNTINKTVTTDSTLAGGSNGDFYQDKVLAPFRLSASLYPMLGFNYFFSKHFSLGAEFGLGLTVYMPNKSSEIISQRFHGKDYPDTDLGNTTQKATISLSKLNNAVITAGIYF